MLHTDRMSRIKSVRYFLLANWNGAVVNRIVLNSQFFFSSFLVGRCMIRWSFGCELATKIRLITESRLINDELDRVAVARWTPFELNQFNQMKWNMRSNGWHRLMTFSCPSSSQVLNFSRFLDIVLVFLWWVASRKQSHKWFEITILHYSTSRSSLCSIMTFYSFKILYKDIRTIRVVVVITNFLYRVICRPVLYAQSSTCQHPWISIFSN